jgi:hypothetical protein
MENFLTGFLLSDVLHVGEHVIGEESHPKRMELWQVTSCRDKNRVLAGSSKMSQKRVFVDTLMTPRHWPLTLT